VANPKLHVGDPAPSFSLATDQGTTLALADLKGQRTVLYFYPKDDTPGCTTQACDFRDNLARLESTLGVRVLGISPDPVASHVKFKQKYGLPFTLLADPDHATAEAYGVWRERTKYGRTSVGLVRATFVIGPDGRLEKVYDNVRAQGHVERLLADLA
jgi:thioredoxin-dependent peroxiredoxin